MKLLKEDMKKLEDDFPGAKEFLEAAERRYAAYVRVRRIHERGGKAVASEACREEWFLNRLKREGLSVTLPKDKNLDDENGSNKKSPKKTVEKKKISK